jgi:hypothetical protein
MQERIEATRQVAAKVLVPTVEDIVDRIGRAHGPDHVMARAR